MVQKSRKPIFFIKPKRARSVFTTKDKRATAVATKLAEHYGAETIVYKV
jgi:hypothetical protein